MTGFAGKRFNTLLIESNTLATTALASCGTDRMPGDFAVADADAATTDQAGPETTGTLEATCLAAAGSRPLRDRTAAAWGTATDEAGPETTGTLGATCWAAAAGSCPPCDRAAAAGLGAATAPLRLIETREDRAATPRPARPDATPSAEGTGERE